MNNEQKKLLNFKAKIELARRNFFWYCNLMMPNFYKPNRGYLKEICDKMQSFYEGNEQILIINCPPRHGKSLTAQLFTQWVLGQDNSVKVMTGSYNQTLSTTFSKNVRNAIQTEKVDAYIPVFSDVFPKTKIKRGEGAMNLWSLEGAYNSYLATSPDGTATGFGATLLIIDDLIKNYEESVNENVLDKHWEWFANTMLSRLEEGGKVILIMTRWASGDLSGRVEEWCVDKCKRYSHINMKAIQDDGSMLCNEILSYESAMDKKALMGADVFSANYQQIPIDIQGKLYSGFKTYDVAPEFRKISAYIDTADKGSDYLSVYVYGEYDGEAYVIDTLYTQQPMEITEELTAEMLYKSGCNECVIEGNNGGDGFARSVKRILRETYGSNKCSITTFHQSKNKEARILSNATWCMEHIYFPTTWKNKWRELYDALFSYQRMGRNKHDDAQDALTGIAERMTNQTNKIKKRLRKDWII